MIIDGKDAVLGRLSSMSAKKLMKGEEVVIINADKVIVTGRPNDIKQEYIAKRRIGSPQHGPFFPRQPNMIVRRTIRGMLPYKTDKGRAAFKKLRVYNGDNGMQGESIAVKTVKTKFMTMGEVGKILGWNGR